MKRTAKDAEKVVSFPWSLHHRLTGLAIQRTARRLTPSFLFNSNWGVAVLSTTTVTTGRLEGLHEPNIIILWFTFDSLRTANICQHNPLLNMGPTYCLFSELRGNTVRDSEATGRELNVNSENSEIKLPYISLHVQAFWRLYILSEALRHMGVSENVVYPIVPNGFADHYPYYINGYFIGNIPHYYPNYIPNINHYYWLMIIIPIIFRQTHMVIDFLWCWSPCGCGRHSRRGQEPTQWQLGHGQPADDLGWSGGAKDIHILIRDIYHPTYTIGTLISSNISRISSWRSWLRNRI